MAENIPPAIAPFKRTAWKPIVEDGDGAPYASKFSGLPWLTASEDWPPCGNCGKPAQLFIQLNLDLLPEPLRNEFGRGLLQMFYCTSADPACDVDCEGWSPFSRCVTARVVQPQGDPRVVEASSLVNAFPPKLITGWQELDDYPTWAEGEGLAVELEDSEWKALNGQGFARDGDKLAGWPAWQQGVEYPACPICSEEMRLVFQLDSEDNLPFMFGDVGCGHITQCKTHKDQVAFGWACG